MPTHQFAFEDRGPKRFEISTKALWWNNVSVRLDGKEIGGVPDLCKLRCTTKLKAIDKQSNNDIVHLSCFGKTNCFAS